MKLSVTVRLYLLAAVTVFIVVACERVPLTSPTGSTIQVQVSETTLPVNGQATVQAIVTESSGTPVHNGTQVNFLSALGSFNPPSATTVGGIATTVFSAGSVSGTTKINAYSGGASTGSGNSSAGGVEVKIGAAAAGSVALQVIPPTVPQNGGTVQATALVLDASGNPLRGVPVLFSVDTGTLSAATVVTDVNGYAVTNLVTTRASVITARAGTAPAATFNVGVNVPPTVTITTSTTAPVVGQPVAFTVTPSTSANASPISSVVVDFGDGRTQTLGAITGPVGLTHTYSRQGGYTVSATATDIIGGRGTSSVSLVVGFESIPTVTLSVTPNPVLTANQGVATITVTATAGTGGAPIRTVRVTLASDGSTLYSGTGSGTFAHKFPSSGGTFTLNAVVTDAAGATGTTSTVVIVQPYTP